MAAAVSSEKPDPKRRKVCPSREGDGKHARLLSWLKRYGCQLAPWLEIGEAEGQGLCVRVRALAGEATTAEAVIEVAEEEDGPPILAEVPARAILSDGDAWAEPVFGALLRSIPDSLREACSWSREQDLMAFLGWLRSGASEAGYADRTDFTDYALSLPDEFGDTTHWPPDQVAALLGGTSLHHETERLVREELRPQFEKIVRVYLNAQGAFPEFRVWLWCRSAYRSRCFSRRLKASATVPVMLPLIDVFNHRTDYPVTVSRHVSAAETEAPEPPSAVLALTESVELEPGAQVYNNYGGKGNEELLLGYGFVEQGSPYDRVQLTAGALFGRPAAAERAKELMQKLLPAAVSARVQGGALSVRPVFLPEEAQSGEGTPPAQLDSPLARLEGCVRQFLKKALRAQASSAGEAEDPLFGLGPRSVFLVVLALTFTRACGAGRSATRDQEEEADTSESSRSSRESWELLVGAAEATLQLLQGKLSEVLGARSGGAAAEGETLPRAMSEAYLSGQEALLRRAIEELDALRRRLGKACGGESDASISGFLQALWDADPVGS